MAHWNLMMIKKGLGCGGVGLGLSPPWPAAPCRTRIIIVDNANITSSAGRGRVRVPLLLVRDRDQDRVSDGSRSMTGTEEAFATNSENTQTNYKSSSSSPSEMWQGKEQEHDTDDVVVQYVVLRRDLIETWPLGSVVTQGCHASVSAIWSHKDDHHTLHYCSPSNIDSMHKVTLEVKGEPQILNLSQKLTAGGIAHKLWIEQPENIPTCLATKPYPKSVVAMFFRKLKLCK